MSYGSIPVIVLWVCMGCRAFEPLGGEVPLVSNLLGTTCGFRFRV